ncbi:uncharacterized protein LOC122248935 [Penaeus japonicus]|uniref:uncharacterized protein LOC122248935 n=1 Tax=Penaeus japonicus TaxID=27405 RepID=UPI001C7127B3|nr:uncharacterized protein LOC122248935 [Penaeus japonicus]
MSSSKRSSRDKKETTSLFGEADVATLPRDDRTGLNQREIVSSIIRNAWSAAQKWTIARKAGGLELKRVADAVVNAGSQDELKPEIHQTALQLKSSVSKMQACVRILDDLLEEMKKLQNLYCKDGDYPLFSTLTLGQMVSVLESVCEDYKKETEVKAGVCAPLPFTNSPDTLSTVITLWSHHAHVVTHQYPLKLMLRETQQL